MRLPLRLLLAVTLLGTAHAAAARGIAVPGRVVLDPLATRAVPAGSAGTHATTSVPVGLTPGAVLIDSTYYDLQDMGSMGHHIEVGSDGRVHLTWQDDFCNLAGLCPPNLGLSQPYPQRGMGYAYRDAVGTWHNLGKVSDPRVASLRCCGLAPEEFGGFGSLAVTPSGRAIIAQHLNEDGCDLHADFYLEGSAGGSTWDAYIPPIAGGDSFLFPQAAVTPSGGVTLLGEVPIGGSYAEARAIGISWFPATGSLYTCFNWQGQAWANLVARPPAASLVPATLFRDSVPAFPSLAASSNGRVGVAVGDFGGNVFLIESSNGTFAANTITIRNLTGYSDASIIKGDSTSAEYRPYIHCSLAYADTTPHVVWSEAQARRVGGQLEYVDWHSRIRHWSPDRGLQTVYQVPAGVADHYDDLGQGLDGPLCGFNSISADWPQVGFSDDLSEVYVAWLRFTDGQVDPTAVPAGFEGFCTGTGFGDIACSVTRAGQPWSAMQNLTNTPSTDERFFSLATRNPGGKLNLVYQASSTNEAGSALIGDRGGSPGNLLRRIAYLEIKPTASVLAVGPVATPRPRALSASPNPVFGAARVMFSATLDPSPARRVEVYSLDGRRVVSLPMSQNAPVAWDGRDDGGHRVPSGVYFARLSDQPTHGAIRIVLAR
jgi:hypothetical protein